MRTVNLVVLVCLSFLALPVWAQTPDVAASPSADAVSGANVDVASDALARALAATPPERAKLGQALAQSPERLAEIDAWIAQTDVDAPQNLIMRDLLLAMPKSVSGSRLVALAKKARDPNVQNSWKRHLEAYPGPYANVLAAWTVAASDDPDRFMTLLREFAQFQPEAALKLWAQLIENNTVEKLDRVADYGLTQPGAVAALLTRLDEPKLDEAQRLRLYRALTKAVWAQVGTQDVANDTVKRDVADLLENKAVSRRIVGLDVVGALKITDFVQKAATTFKDAKNTTERAHALIALVLNDPTAYHELVLSALTDGDEILRMTAAELLNQVPALSMQIEEATLKNAFDKEIWPETQLSLYHAILARTDDADFAKKVMLNTQVTPETRMAAVNGLTASAELSFTLDDMATLQRTGATVDLIATVAELLYDHHVDDREKLRTWIAVQRPFERRLLTTFARFVAIDGRETNETLDYVRDVCKHAVEEENILQPCIAYFEDHASTDADKALLSQLTGRKKQFDMMMDL